MKLPLQTLLLTLSLLLGATVAHADVLRLPAATQTAPAPANLPHRGMSMANVRSVYGQPVKRHPAVGGHGPKRPPITRWDYPGFSVIFENSTVIDTVRPGQPPRIYHQHQLQADQAPTTP